MNSLSLCFPAAVAPQISWTWWWTDFPSLFPPTKRPSMAAGGSVLLPAPLLDRRSSSWPRRTPVIAHCLGATSQMAATSPSYSSRAQRTPLRRTKRSNHHTPETGWAAWASGTSQTIKTLDWQAVGFRRISCGDTIVTANNLQRFVRRWLWISRHWQLTHLLPALSLVGCSSAASGPLWSDELRQLSADEDWGVFVFETTCWWYFVGLCVLDVRDAGFWVNLSADNKFLAGF